MKSLLRCCCALLIAWLLCGAAKPAPDEAKALFEKISKVGRSLQFAIDHKHYSESLSDLNAAVAAFCAKYPETPAKGKITQVMAAYRDVEQLLNEALNAMEHGEDALVKDSRPYQTLAGRYFGLFERLAGQSQRNPANGRIYYFKIDVAREINNSCAVKYQNELRQILGLL